MDGRSKRRWYRIFKPDPRTEVEDELAFHLEQRVQDYIARGLDPDAARAAAEQRMGSVERVRSECTDLLTSERRRERRRDGLQLSWLDFKLGFRMLSRYPGLTIVGGIAMAFAIWVGAGTFEVINQLVFPKLPLPDGDRVVAIQNWDVSLGRHEDRMVHDYLSWKGQLQAVTDLGAFRTIERNLAVEQRSPEPIGLAEISASAFPLTRVNPLLGRTLTVADEQPGAPAVVVIGYDVWQRRFDADPAVVGRIVRLGNAPATVVGVMPKGFAFPVSHDAWVPLRLNRNEAAREGPGILVFGRLAPGASLADAQAELRTVGQRASTSSPTTHQHLRPQVKAFAKAIMPNIFGSWVLSFNLFVVMLVVLVCGNVALLMFARASSRESEIVVRNALGASRGRIVTQLFAEALVLGAVAAVVGLAAHRAGLRWALLTADSQIRGGLPFWFQGSLSLPTLLYSAGLTLLGATIAGVIPALKVTRGLQSRLRESAAGGGGMRFGGIWTAIIVAQIAVTLAFPATAFFVRREMAEFETRITEAGFPAERWLTAQLRLDREGPNGQPISDADFDAQLQKSWQALERRLEADPAVAGVTYANRLPLMYHPYRLIELDSGEAAPLDPRWPGYRVSSAAIEPAFFDKLGTPLLEGRNFTHADIESGQSVIIVNKKFVDLVLGGRNAIGRRLRFTHFEEWGSPRSSDDQPWYEIIGVAPDLGTEAFTHDPKVARIHHPATPNSAYPFQIAVQVKGDPKSYAQSFRQIAASVDPSLRLHEITPLNEVSNGDVALLRFWFRLVLAVSGVALLLSLAAIYAVMAFTVSRRTREIGIRSALGGSRRRILASVFARPIAQIGGGILAGVVLVGLLGSAIAGGMLSVRETAALVGYALLMSAVCALACFVPARRALSIQPTEAFRTDG